MNNRQCEKAKANLRDNKVPGLMLSVGRRAGALGAHEG